MTEWPCYGSPQLIGYCPGFKVDGTRTQTIVNQTATPYQGQYLLTGTYDVDFDGRLSGIGDIPIKVSALLRACRRHPRLVGQMARAGSFTAMRRRVP
ncbi:hypothetical protein [Sphingomonas oryzagri]|uniref:Uncharacterized protein n=1 Tax=Sphingomonas oryzagri TaxID=3042314 RepID=A0ABT6N3R6_9SPHN|nr:hypothetical protein [Sphingomonas oryzagri]MDH7639945.1 hypothetical protein [Sphingomonas oryzagri]